MSIATTFVHTPRMTFHCRSHGAPDGDPMLLLHGSFGSSRWWEPFMALLPDEIYAMAPDLRGCGLSQSPIDEGDGLATWVDIGEQAQDIHSLVAALGWRDFDLVGHSSGGAMAMELAINHGELLASLTLVDSTPVEGVFTPLETLELLHAMQSDRVLLASALALLMPSYMAHVAPESDAFFQQLVQDAAQMATPLFTGLAEALGRWNRLREAGGLTLPTLLIRGELDEIVSQDAATRTLIALPGANNLEILRGVGHSPMIEAPLTLAERIIDFITEDYGYFAAVRDSADE
ncbi:MAG: alpha/beta hydrolase [Caldilineaceae bacterium]|nr:alpha/beta hydrolase [Caldilineaceae bacterium]